MRFRVLGPLELRDDQGRLVRLGAAKQRAVLGVLLVHANRPVGVDLLAEALWGEQPPRSAVGGLRTYVSALRLSLGLNARAGGAWIAALPGAYQLTVAAEELDLLVFERCADEGQRALADGQLQLAAEWLEKALGLWRGRPMEDLPLLATLEGALVGLEERRLAVVTAWAQACLALGRHEELLPELGRLIIAEPLWERLWGLWMLALYRSGRQAEALEAYRQLRRRLVQKLGIEPSPPLQRLQRRILQGDRTLVAPDLRAIGNSVAAPLVPRQLPPDVVGFTGRAGELERLGEGRVGAGDGPLLWAISGPGGVGKSALAIHAAHGLADQFADGQLYVDLQGATPGLAPLEPLEALGRLLRALGPVSGQIPPTVEEAAARWRSLAAERRLLLVLDNARDAKQVRPLLPAGRACAALVTCRRALVTLEQVRHIHISQLSVDEAVRLLGLLAGGQRIAAEPEAAAEVARLCGLLPLALRIAAARLAARPGWTVAALVERLADERRRLDELELSDLAVRTSFQASYQELRDSGDPVDRAAAAAFWLLGVPDGASVSVPGAVRLLDQPGNQAERVLERLADVQLLESFAGGRYRLHDLLRLYAREHAREHLEEERQAALRRLFRHYVATAWHTMALLRPGRLVRLAEAHPDWTSGGLELEGSAAALDWLEAERANLLAAVEQAARTPQLGLVATQLAQALFGFFWVRSYWHDWEKVNRTALIVAQRMGDQAAQAWAHNDLGLALQRLGRYEEALASLEDSLRIREGRGDRHGQAASLNNLGLIAERRGSYDQALARYRQSLEICRELGNPHGEADILYNLGAVHGRQGRYDQALVCHRQSLVIYRDLSDRHGEAVSLARLAVVRGEQGCFDEALTAIQRSLAIFRELGDRHGEAEALADLGVIRLRQGRYEDALTSLRESLTIHRGLDDRYGQADTLREAGRALSALGHDNEAREHWRQSLETFEQLGADANEVRALLTEPSRGT